MAVDQAVELRVMLRFHFLDHSTERVDFPCNAGVLPNIMVGTMVLGNYMFPVTTCFPKQVEVYHVCCIDSFGQALGLQSASHHRSSSSNRPAHRAR